MATDLKGTAVGTLGKTPEEQALNNGIALAKQLQTLFPAPAPSEGVNPQTFFAPLLADIQNAPAPEAAPVPDTRLTLGRALGLFATNVGAQLTGQPAVGFPYLLQRKQQAEEIERQNVAQSNAFKQTQYAQFLTTRQGILQAAYQKALQNEEFDKAAQIQERKFVLDTALGQLQQQQAFAQQRALAQLDNQGKTDVAKISGILDFLGSRAASAGLSYGQRTSLSPSDESNAIFKLMDATNQIDLKLQPEGGVWIFGNKVPTDEEMGAQLRTMGAALSLPSQNVRDLALNMIQGTLQARYGNNTAAKVKFLQSQGLSILAPTANEAPLANPPSSIEAQGNPNATKAYFSRVRATEGLNSAAPPESTRP